MKDIKARIARLAQAAEVSTPAPLNQCWVDAKVVCPYGEPEGQYRLRPEGFCNKTCVHFPQEIIANKIEIEDLGTKKIIQHFEDNKVSVTSELEVRAKELKNDHCPSESLVLTLAAEIITAHEFDRLILLEDDLPDDLS